MQSSRDGLDEKRSDSGDDNENETQTKRQVPSFTEALAVLFITPSIVWLMRTQHLVKFTPLLWPSQLAL